MDIEQQIPEPVILPRKIGKKQRAGFTKNHGNGQSKQRRKMTKQSKRINR